MFAFLRKSKLSGFRFIPFNIISSKRVRRPESVYRLKRPAFLLSGPNDDDLKVCRFLRASCAKWTWKFSGLTTQLSFAHGVCEIRVNFNNGHGQFSAIIRINTAKLNEMSTCIPYRTVGGVYAFSMYMSMLMCFVYHRHREMSTTEAHTWIQCPVAWWTRMQHLTR